MLGFGSVTCPECGERAQKDQKFCSKCGAGLPTGQIKCGNCQAVVAASSKYCTSCGKALSEGRAATVAANRWARREGDFATRIEVPDVQGFLRRPLVVESGLKALFFSGGRLAGELPPGTYDMGGLLSHIANLGATPMATVVLVDAADTALDFSLERIQTSDPVLANVNCRIVLQVAQSILFFNNVMKGRQAYSVSELRESLQAEMRNAVQEYARGRSFDDLISSVDMKNELQGIAERHLRTTFERNGLDFVQVRVFEFRHAGVEEYVRDREELAIHQRRAAVWDAMRQAVASEKMAAIRSEEELRDFLAEVDKAHLIREDELAGVARALGERVEDHEFARQHLLDRLGLERDLELRSIQLAGEQKLNAEEVQHQIEMERQQHIAEMEREWREFDRDTAEISGLLDLKDRKERDELARRREEMTAQAEFIERLSAFGAEALIMAADSEKAQLLAGLQKTKLLKDYTPDQILAMAADGNTEIAKAFQEKFKGMPADDLVKVYERMLGEKDKSATEVIRTQREFAQLTSQMFQSGLDAVARGGRSGGTSVVVPGRQGVVVTDGVAGPAPVSDPGTACPNCKAQLPADAKFCGECGHSIG